ncbi:MAG TPA: oligosaccharide flippase family protein, partial [Chitinophagaceae bacterium]|nr:oligosaccharide flippase family protein [Chitinophagaceae bacterium]
KTITGFTLMAGAVGILISIGFSFFAPSLFDNPLLGTLLKVYAISLLGNKLSQVLNQALIRVNRTKQVMLISVLFNFVKLVLALIAIQKFHSISMLLIIYGVEPILNSAVQYLILARGNFTKGHFKHQLLKDIFAIGFPLYLVEILGASYTYIAGFIISINLNETQYAIYRNGSFEIPVVGTIYSTISILFMADMSKYIHEGNFKLIAQIKRRIISTTAVIIFPVAIYFIFFSKDFILMYMSSKYLESYKVFMVFTAALLLRTQNYMDVLVLLKKTKYVLFSFAVFLVTNISLNIGLSYSFGILGCAAATIFSVLILATLQLFLTIRELKVTINDYIDFAGLAKILIISIAWIALFKLGSMELGFPAIPTFLFTASVSLSTLYIFFIKRKFIDIHQFKPIFEKIPLVGMRVFNLLK